MAKSRGRRAIIDRLTPEQLSNYVAGLKDFTLSPYGVLSEFLLDDLISERMCREHRARVKRGEDPVVFLKAHSLAEQAEEGKAIGDSVEQKNKGEVTELTVNSTTRIETVEQALAKANVDLTLWDVERFLVNSWEVGARGPDKLIRVTPLWQVKVWLKAKKGWSPTEFRKILVEQIAAQAPSYTAYEQWAGPELESLVELSIFDAHFGKLGWIEETGQNYDLRICEERYLNAARCLLHRSMAFKPGKVLYVVGNDFFHTDQGRAGLTTNGTPQDCDGRWQKAFRIGCSAAITIAEEAANNIAPVDILVVPGNHDAEKSFCMGEVLAARFHQHPQIRVINTPDVYSYYRWGKVLLGFVHGDNHTSDKKRAELPQTMATDRPKDWSETVWREWHLGHFHSELEDVWKIRTAEHVRDVALRVLPSLSSTDAWHRRSGYKSVLAAEAHIYHRDKGRQAYLVHAVEE